LSDSSTLPLLTHAEIAKEVRYGTLVLDMRRAEQFAAFHIRGAIQISLMGNFSSWAAIIIDPAQQLLLIAEDARAAQEARNRLERVRLDNVIGYAIADADQWRRAGLELGSIPIERCEDVRQNLASPSSPQLVDVRSRAEWLRGHLPGAVSLPLLDIDSAKDVIDPSRTALVYCQQGFRATTAASVLLRNGALQVGILVDGIEGWSALGLPLEIPRPG
jgi:rhodanese-related sulfurtransferase